MPEGGGELLLVRVRGAIGVAGRVQQLPLRADGGVLEAGRGQVGRVRVDVEHGPRGRVDAVDAEGRVAIRRRERRHDVAHGHGRVGGAAPVVAVRHLELVLVRVAEEHGCDRGLVPVHDLVEVVAVVVESVARARRHVADYVHAVACVLGRLELRHEPRELRRRVPLQRILVEEVVLDVVHVCVEGDDAQVVAAARVLGGVGAELDRRGVRSRRADPRLPDRRQEVVDPLRVVPVLGRGGKRIRRAHLVVARRAVEQGYGAGGAGVHAVDVFGIVGLAGEPDSVVDDVTREDAKGRVGHERLDGVEHALLQHRGGIAVMVAVGAGRGVVVTGRVGLGVGAAAYGFRAVCVGALRIERVNVRVGEVDDLDWCLTAGGRTAVKGRFRGRERDSPWFHVRVVAKAREGDAKELAGLATDRHVPQVPSDDGPLEGDGALAHVVVDQVADLADARERGDEDAVSEMGKALKDH